MDTPNLQQLKSDIHRILLSKMDLEKLSTVNNGRAVQTISLLIQDIVAKEKVPLNATEKERLQGDLLDEVFGLGPLEPLLKDHTISDILVNKKDLVYVERKGVLEKSDVKFRDDRSPAADHRPHRGADRPARGRIVAHGGRPPAGRLARQCDHSAAGSRWAGALDPPLRGLAAYRRKRCSILKSISPEMLEVLKAAVRARISILISGGTGAGKTTFLNMLSQYIPETERLVTIEDAAELQIQQENVVRLETRPPNVEGKGAVRQRQLLINSLRMRPDRIIIGEVRGEEAFDMLQAMNTGHEGSMTTIHANTCRDALSRLESMVAMANLNLPEKAVRQQIASAIGIVVQISRMSDGTPQGGQHRRDHRHGKRHDQHAGHLYVCEKGDRTQREGGRNVSAQPHPSQVRRAYSRLGGCAGSRVVRAGYGSEVRNRCSLG